MPLELWLTFLIAALIISISPGAGAVNTMSNGMLHGVRGAIPAILGLQLGYGAQIIAVGIGLGALLASSAHAFTVIKWLGVAYLIWLGYQRWTAPPLDLQAPQADKRSSVRQQFWHAALVNLTNPKATIFLLALFPQFIDANAPLDVVAFVMMGSTLVLADIVVMLGYAGLAAQLSRLLRNEHHQRMLNRIFGGMFVGAAVIMANARVS